MHLSCAVSLPWNLFFKTFDTCSTDPRYKPHLLRFLGLSRYFSIDGPIHQAKFFVVFVCSIASWYLPRSIENFCRWHLLNTSRSIELLFSIKARYLLNLSSYVFYIYIEVQPSFETSQISRSFSFLSWPKYLFFTKINLPSLVSFLSKLHCVGKSL